MLLTSPYGIVYNGGESISPYGIFSREASAILPNGITGGNMLITDAKEFGLALRRRRKELGYTQAFLSEVSGFSVTFISDLEN